MFTTKRQQNILDEVIRSNQIMVQYHTRWLAHYRGTRDGYIGAYRMLQRECLHGDEKLRARYITKMREAHHTVVHHLANLTRIMELDSYGNKSLKEKVKCPTSMNWRVS